MKELNKPSMAILITYSAERDGNWVTVHTLLPVEAGIKYSRQAVFSEIRIIGKTTSANKFCGTFKTPQQNGGKKMDLDEIKQQKSQKCPLFIYKYVSVCTTPKKQDRKCMHEVDEH